MLEQNKVTSIKKLREPKNVQELRSFLGIINYCRDYIPNLATSIAPLTDLLKGETMRSKAKIIFSKGDKNAFAVIKGQINEDMKSIQPMIYEDFILTIDASEVRIRAILSQVIDGKERMISAFSKKLDKHQINYSITDKEPLALVKGVENYRHYLLGKKFLLKTDHKALAHLGKTKDLKGRMMRWALLLQEYVFDIQYILGEENIADRYSRIFFTEKQGDYKKAVTCKSEQKEIFR